MPEVRPTGRRGLQTVSVVDALEQTVRDEILSGTIPAGKRIKEAPLAQELAVSRHTLRAALSRLESVGLLQYRENRGWSVPVFGEEEYADILLLRESLEASAFRVAIERGARATPAVSAAVGRIEDMTAENSWQERIDADCAFHQTLVDLAGSPRISRAYAAMMDEFRLCRLQSIEWLEQLPLEKWKEMHVSLVRSLEEGGVQTMALLTRHATSNPWNSPRAETAP